MLSRQVSDPFRDRHVITPNAQVETPRSLFVLAALLFAAALVRVAAWLYFDPVVDNEGAIYLRLAENLRTFQGYLGLFGEKHSLMPPLFPILLAAIGQAVGDVEIAARIICLGLGAATILPVYGIASRLGGSRAAEIAGLFAAFHGLLIALSESVYSETMYFFLIACAIYFALRTVEAPGWRNAACTGLTFGLAYLVRPEAIVYPLIVAGFLVGMALIRRLRLDDAARNASIVVLVAGLVVTPYVVWLSGNSGYVRVDGKSVINGLVAERMREGITYLEATRGLGPDLEPIGVFLAVDQFALGDSSSDNVRRIVHTLASDLRGRARSIVEDTLRTSALGGIPFLALAGLGFAMSLRHSSTRVAAGLMALFSASYFVVLLTVQFRWTRYLFPFALFALPWAAVGAATVLAWLRPWISRHVVARVAAVAAMVSLVAVPSTIGAARLGEFTQLRDSELRSAGRWLATQSPGEKLIAGISAVLPYYADARLVYLPWAEESRALAFLRKVGPDFVAVRTHDEAQAPYLADWKSRGLDYECVGEPSSSFPGPAGTLSIYRWTCEPEDANWLNQICRIGDRHTPLCSAIPGMDAPVAVHARSEFR